MPIRSTSAAPKNIPAYEEAGYKPTIIDEILRGDHGPKPKRVAITPQPGASKGRANSVISIESASSNESGYSYTDTMQRRQSGDGVFVCDSYRHTDPGILKKLYSRISMKQTTSASTSREPYVWLQSSDGRTLATNGTIIKASHTMPSGDSHSRFQKIYHFPTETAQGIDAVYADTRETSNDGNIDADVKSVKTRGSDAESASWVTKKGVRISPGKLRSFRIKPKGRTDEVEPEPRDGEGLLPVRRLVRRHRRGMLHGIM